MRTAAHRYNYDSAVDLSGAMYSCAKRGDLGQLLELLAPPYGLDPNSYDECGNMTSSKVRAYTSTSEAGAGMGDGWGGAFYARCVGGVCVTNVTTGSFAGFGIVHTASTNTGRCSKGAGCNSCSGAYGGSIFSQHGELNLDRVAL